MLNPKENSSTFSLLVECIRRDSFACLSDLSDAEAREFATLASRHKLRLRVADGVRGGALAPWREETLREDDASRLLAIETIGGLSDGFESERVRAAVVKGVSFERCVYGDGRLRDLGDIDLLVAPGDAEAAHRALLGLGYRQRMGPSSAAGLFPKGRAAICASQGASRFGEARLGRPLRKHPRKHEYAPYAKDGHPTVELHDGFCGLPDGFVESLVASVGDAGCRVVPEPEMNLALLLANTHENSESFFSNAFDYAMTLRDYVDLRCFFERYRDSLDWRSASELIERIGMRKRAKAVLRNLDDVFGGGGDLGCLSRTGRASSVWGIGILDRLADEGLARQASVGVFRKELFEAAKPLLLPISADRPRSSVDGRGVGFSMVRRCGSLFAAWSIPDAVFNDRHLLQVCLYPLEEGAEVLAYKIDLGFYDGSLRAYGHATARLLLGAAVRKKTSCPLPVAVERQGSSARAEAQLDSLRDRLGIDFEEGRFAVSASVCRQEHGDVFWDILPNRAKILDGVCLGRVGLLASPGNCFSVGFSRERYSFAVGDAELALRLREALPQAVGGWLIDCGEREDISLQVAKDETGAFSIEENGALVAGDLDMEEASCLLMQGMSDRFCLHAEGGVFVAHAAAVRWGESVVVLMGPSGSGKTSLAVAFSRFAPLMGDECVFVDAGTGEAWCEDFPFQIKDSNGDILDLLGWPRGLAAKGGPHGETHYYSRWRVNADESPETPGVISHIVFPEYDRSIDGAFLGPFPQSRFVQGVLGSFMGDCPPAEALKAFARMTSRRCIKVMLLRYGSAVDAAAVLDNYLVEEGRWEESL